MKRIAINTGGGDAPGLNAVICAAVRGADQLGWEVWGIRDGYEGILEPDRCKKTLELFAEKVMPRFR